jgi:hypothetical protein
MTLSLGQVTPKRTDLQAMNLSPGDKLIACRSVIFGTQLDRPTMNESLI